MKLQQGGEQTRFAVQPSSCARAESQWEGVERGTGRRGKYARVARLRPLEGRISGRQGSLDEDEAGRLHVGAEYLRHSGKVGELGGPSTETLESRSAAPPRPAGTSNGGKPITSRSRVDRCVPQVRSGCATSSSSCKLQTASEARLSCQSSAYNGVASPPRATHARIPPRFSVPPFGVSFLFLPLPLPWACQASRFVAVHAPRVVAATRV